MSARGAKKRGRPPKVQVSERTKKFQYHLLKKPKYLLNYQKKDADSQSSTPSASRASSPHDSESRRSSTRTRGSRAGRKSGYAGSAYQRRGYNTGYDYQDSEYHYGSDFGDDDSDKSEIEDEVLSESDVESLGGPSSDSDFSLSSYSTVSGTPRKQNLALNRAPTPEPLWLQNREIPALTLPRTSEDLLVSKECIMEVVSIYEVLRHFRNLVRLSPFRLEDFCAAIVCEDQSSLLSEIHIMLLKALFREEDSQQTHFGPLDQKDSVNIALYLIDNITYPEVLRAYVESDKSFDQNVLHILTNNDYPFTCVEDRIKVLQFLTDQFLITNPVREDLLSEVPMHYDDHCRVCHKLGDLLCCETCPAVYHLECVDPPLVHVPEEDWQCGICRSHKVSGVVDCVLDLEKQGQLSRQQPLGFDRHGRKYYFLCRRIFVESQEGEIWYYSIPVQFEELLKSLDKDDMEAELYRELSDYKEEIIRQMELTEKLTNQLKANKKTYFDAEQAAILKEIKEREERLAEQEKERERQNAEDMVAKMHEDCEEEVPTTVVHSETVSTTSEGTSADKEPTQVSTAKSGDESQDEDQKMKDIVTRSKTGSLTPRMFNIDDLKRKSLGFGDEKDESRLTRQRTNQIANGTYLFKLGMENTFKSYVNQFTTNIIALNKPQRNEERDKKRHLSHKFSLTPASEFKWVGGTNGTKVLLMNTLRHSILQLEQVVPTPFMHPNWHLVRKHWLNVVGNCQSPKDFAKTLIVLQACIKPVCFANVWHDQLGHSKLSRITAQEREERKKIEKREKKDREEEEERNRLIISSYVKYTMGFKHQLWKQKGEEYRIHGRWGWLWIRIPRNYKPVDSSKLGLSGDPQRYMLQIKDKAGQKKIVSLSPNMYRFLMNKLKNGDATEKKEESQEISETDKKIEETFPEVLKNIEIIPIVNQFEEIDVSKALTTPGRLLYPKVAKKGSLDELLARRLQLKILEERKIAQSKTGTEQNEPKKDDEHPEEEEDSHQDTGGVEKQLNNMLTGKVAVSQPGTPVLNRELINNIAKRINNLRTQYSAISKVAKDFQCYSKGCNSSSSHQLESNCYSPLCIQRVKIRRDLLTLLRRANVASNSPLKAIMPAGKKSSILEQTLKAPQLSVKENEGAMCKDLVNAVLAAESAEDESKQDVYVPMKGVSNDVKCEIKEEIVKKEEDNSELKDEPMDIDVTCTPSDDKKPPKKEEEEENCIDVDMENMSPDAIKEMIIGSKSDITQITTTTTTSVTTTRSNDGKIKTLTATQTTTNSLTVKNSNGAGHSLETHNTKSATYMAQQNRRFCGYKVGIKREEKVIKTEHAEDGSERVYSTSNTAGKIFLKKLPSQVDIRRKKRQIVKYPACSTFQARKGVHSLLVLPQHDVRKLARNSGKIQVLGYNFLAKQNNLVWPYPCARPLFKTCWIYRTVNLKSLAAAALQLRILWATLRWDDMQTKPPNTEGKHQITTETEILSLELLKHRHVGQFLEKTQYLRRKVVIPLELPKTVREVTSIRSGLRKRKRPESPQSMDPQVTEEWVDEDKLELWEIKQYGEKVEKANQQVVTRSRTGNLPPPRPLVQAPDQEPNKVTVTNKATPEEIKEKMEQQLRLQRAAHQQKRALEVKSLNVKNQIDLTGTTTTSASSGTSTTTSASTEKSSSATATTSTTTSSTTNSLKPIQPKVSTAEGNLKVVKNVVVPSQAVVSGKNTLTSLLTNSNKIAGRRILMTKGPDGTTRVLTGPAGPSLPKQNSQQPSQQQQQPSLVKLQSGSGQQAVQQQVVTQVATPAATPTLTPSKDPQKVQIMRTPDGRITVKGLMPGQQLVQFPDGKLQVLTTTQTVAAAAPATTQPKQPVVAATSSTPVKHQIIKPAVSASSAVTPAGKVQLRPLNTQQQQQQQQPGQQQILLSPKGQQVFKQQGQPTLQKIVQGQVAVGGHQVVQQQVVVGSNQVISTQGGQQVITNQIVVNNPNLAQQLATGKVQVATVNGQQVLIRPTGNNQAQVIAQLTPGSITQGIQGNQVVHSVAAPPLRNVAPAVQQRENPAPQPVQPRPTPSQPVQQQTTTPTATPQKQIAIAQTPQQQQQQQSDNQIDKVTMEHLLQGQPPGTVIKCVTAQVIQTQQGPRIVLQGLQGADFTPQQLAAVQQQVKQQLLKAQASTGKQGVLGPTKIYLAVQPANAAQPESITEPISTNPPPLAPVQPSPMKQQLKSPVKQQQSPSSKQPSPISVQATTKPPDLTPTLVPQRQTVANGQQTQTSALLQAMKAKMEGNQQQQLQQQQQQQPVVATVQQQQLVQVATSVGDANKQFIVTPDYIQQTIKTALKQENLNPEIEEKLLQLQRYQEKQMKQEPGESSCPSPTPKIASPPGISVASNVSKTYPVNSRKRPPSTSKNDDADWVIDQPKRSRPNKSSESRKSDGVAPALPETPTKEKPEKIISPRTRTKSGRSDQERHSNNAKAKVMVTLYRQKEMLKKDILRKRALLEKELQYEIQEVADELAARTKIERTKQDEVRTGSSKRKSAATVTTPAIPVHKPAGGRSKKTSKSHHSPGGGGGGHKSKKEKVYCICRTPYDETKFYVGCDLCNNWFHGDCVGITEELSKTLTEFICDECRQARETQKLYCLCQQPYDDSQFYICCDTCQDWFHGRCVGILQSEADNIDEYVCPRCQKNSSVNYVNMKELSHKDYENLKKLIKQIQAHKSAWPFMEPVDPTEAPDYYKVIKEPMDLQMIETKINDHKYRKLSEFIGDMTKIFDNCRYYNPKESPFFKCAESLEAYFVNKIKCLRDKLYENK
ncbi:nucleosome-remodeling factor subunit NURF301 isoform X3 [Anthonomus grandis grandis]|uniref:nucleosome-remodeling factor subunit NURF301 isoform X3 n=1 Tax=Anthonomus grandis grandis TaxID=2921223 RepID=UPI002165214A|nr:nucleosome-remodeling factor subunit NURF301 isoform X3 [Anthonomus grandis grandis]